MRRRNLSKASTPLNKAIVVEGAKREYRYFEQAKANAPDRSSYWNIVPSNGGDPKSIRKILDDIADAVDVIYVVIDGDRFPPYCNQVEAKEWQHTLRLYDSRLKLIKSLPSFEVWFLWHFTDDLPLLDRMVEGEYHNYSEPLKKLLKQHYPRIDSRPEKDWEILFTLLQPACVRARKARTSGSRGPMSDVDLLMRELGYCA